MNPAFRLCGGGCGLSGYRGNDPRPQRGGADASGAGGADGHYAIGDRAAGSRAGVAVSRDAAPLCGGGGEAVAGGVCVRGGEPTVRFNFFLTFLVYRLNL